MLEKYHFFILTWVNMKLIKEKKNLNFMSY